MFRKILIANRGEIACRIIKTARRMGIATVAVHSEADRRALHVAMADEAVCIGPPPAGQSYLDIDRIIEACRSTGADAVHPGYGFLSERAAFASALAATGITFIGPNAAAIEAMGDKLRSKAIAAEAGVSTIPGHVGEVADTDEARRIAEDIGYPVMIKASAGGGGKGMRVAASGDEVADGFERARSEAKASFGDDRILIEKFIENPRHIEIQVLADKHGNIVHLGERECSIQRRNQKVVEEAPSPLLDEATRQRMGAQAVALAKAVGYDSAGTVEFVVSQDRSFYFLEMNTRLQVEHPVTELVTGIDLVEQMICIASGDPLDINQQRVSFKGWAVETRIYAEDPARGFLPSTGRLTTFRPAETGRVGDRSIRIDSGVDEGSEISVHYDPMIAKLVTHGPDRAAAIATQADALGRFVIDGVRHNVPFLAALMAHPRWRDGTLSTRFIADEFPSGFAPRTPEGDMAMVFAAVAVAIDHAQWERRRAAGDVPAYPTKRAVLLGKTRHDLDVTGDETLIVAAPGGERVPVSGMLDPGGRGWRGMVGGVARSFVVTPAVNGLELSHAGHVADIRVLTSRQADLAALMPDREEDGERRALLCPMPGLLKTMLVKEGQAVQAGEPICLIEAMKMEHVLRAEEDATIRSIEARAGDSLAVDAPIVTFA